MQFEKEVYYKLCLPCKNLGNVSISTFHSDFHEKFCLRYELHSVTHTVPGSLGIFVFDSLPVLAAFASLPTLQYGSMIAFKCHVKGPVIPVKQIWCISNTCFRLYIKNLRSQSRWSRKRRLKHLEQTAEEYMTFPAPSNTFSVAAVQPFSLLSFDDLQH